MIGIPRYTTIDQMLFINFNLCSLGLRFLSLQYCHFLMWLLKLMGNVVSMHYTLWKWKFKFFLRQHIPCSKWHLNINFLCLILYLYLLCFHPRMAGFNLDKMTYSSCRGMNLISLPNNSHQQSSFQFPKYFGSTMNYMYQFDSWHSNVIYLMASWAPMGIYGFLFFPPD